MKRLSLIGMVIVVAGFFMLFLSTVGNSQASSPPMTSPIGALIHGQQPAGHMPGIQPNSALAVKGTLTFTSADVEKYLLTDALAQDARSHHFTHTIKFVSAQALGLKLGEDFSQDASTLCYVEFTGSTPALLKEVRTSPRSKPLLFTKAYEVFDGKTGDLITWGAMP